MRTKQKAFTLAELIIVVAMLGALAAVAIPRMSFGLTAKYKAEATARKISASLRKCRQLAITNAKTNPSGFRLTMTGKSASKSIRLTRTSSSYSGYTITNLGTSEIVQTETINSAVSCTGASTFTFGPLGNRLTETNGLVVSASGKRCAISVVSATGMVKCTEKAITSLKKPKAIKPIM
ncbi:MAG: type II secretion system GspH family protein [Anaerohalosphaeraceae bacterium]|nr:type II secretion system GspH family protein [Anaerohalosphaeraceae bacterium]